MNYTIRKARPEDAGSIADILRSLGWFMRLNSEPEPTTKERIRCHIEMCLADDSHSVYVAETEDGPIAGYTSVHWLPYLIHTGPEGYISELFVHELARGQGIGSKLLDTVEAEARERGCYRLMLLNLRIRESYQRGFYKKRGWEERPESANFILILQP